MNSINGKISDLQSSLAVLNATATSESDVAPLSSVVDELNTALDELEASLDSLSEAALTPDDLNAIVRDLSENIESLNTLVNVAIGLSLVASVAAIAAVCLLLRKRVETPN